MLIKVNTSLNTFFCPPCTCYRAFKTTRSHRHINKKSRSVASWQVTAARRQVEMREEIYRGLEVSWGRERVQWTWWRSTDSKYRARMSLSVLVWRGIKAFKERGCSRSARRERWKGWNGFWLCLAGAYFMRSLHWERSEAGRHSGFTTQYIWE